MINITAESVRNFNGLNTEVRFVSDDIELSSKESTIFNKLYKKFSKINDYTKACEVINLLDGKDTTTEMIKGVKEVFEYISDDGELVNDILSFMYNRIAMESNITTKSALEYIDSLCEQTEEFYTELRNEEMAFDITDEQIEALKVTGVEANEISESHDA